MTMNRSIEINFKVNDIVHIRGWTDMIEEHGTNTEGKSISIPFTFTSEMEPFCEERARITEVRYSSSKDLNFYVLDFVDILGRVDF